MPDVVQNIVETWAGDANLCEAAYSSVSITASRNLKPTKTNLIKVTTPDTGVKFQSIS